MLNRIIVAAVIAVGSSVAGRPASAQAAGSGMPAQIVTGGMGEATVSPDRATIMLGVQSRGATAAAAGAENAKRQKAIIDTLRSLGLTAEQISTANYNVYPETQYNQTNGTSRVVAYVVSNTVRADVRRLDDVGKLVDAALAKGANQVSSLQFFSSKADSVRRVALTKAVTNARADAEVLARAAGGTLGPMIELTTEAMPVRPIGVVAGMAAMAKDRVQTPIEPGEQTVTATVTARWVLINR